MPTVGTVLLVTAVIVFGLLLEVVLACVIGRFLALAHPTDTDGSEQRGHSQ